MIPFGERESYAVHKKAMISITHNSQDIEMTYMSFDR